MNRYCLNRFRRYPWTKNCSLLIPSKFLSKFVTNSAMITTTPGHGTRKRRKLDHDQRCSGGKRWKFVSMLKDQGWREWRGRVEAWHSYNFLRGVCPLSVSGARTENVYMFTATLNSRYCHGGYIPSTIYWYSLTWHFLKTHTFTLCL